MFNFRSHIAVLVIICSLKLHAQEFKTIGYLPYYRFQLIDEIQLDKITHLNIAFANPDEQGYLSVSGKDLAPIIKKAHDHNLEVFISLGGGAIPAAIAKNWTNLTKPQNRSLFIQKIIEYTLHNELQGIDMDLEWSHVDENYSGFVLELRDSMIQHGLKLSAALPGKHRYPEVSDDALAAFDWINMMVYNLRGPWDPTNRGPHSPYSFAIDAIQYWTNQGVEKERLTLGVPFYGWDFTNPSNVKALTFNHIVGLDPNNAAKDRTGQIYYNGSSTIADKTELALQQELGGMMIWELGQDHLGEYSLLSVMDELINPLVSVPIIDSDHFLTIYPIPFQNQLKIHLLKPMVNTELVLTDLNGKVLIQKRLATQRDIWLNTSTLPTGFVVLQLISPDIIITQKLIKT